MGSKRNLLIVAAIIVLAIIAWLVLRPPQSEPEPTPPPTTDRPAVQRPPITPPPAIEPSPESTETAPKLVEPPENLDESDSVVLSAVEDFAPKLTTWLTPDQQIRKWVLTVDNLASGNVLSKHRPVNYNISKFETERKDGQLVMSEANYRRAEQLVDTVIAIPPETLASYYETWLPTLDKAYGELGRGGEFDARLRAAIDRILAVKPLEQPPRLEHPSVFYTYAEKDLEDADELSKLMWRLGPENTKKIQDYLRELKKQL